MTLRVLSYGGGVQSTAMLVLAAEGKIDFTVAVFANTGDDSEHPATLAYVRDVAAPYAAAHGIELATVQKSRFEEPETLLGSLERPNHQIAIPMRLGTGAPARRNCTVDFKVLPIARWMKKRGATEADPATLGLGISMDEFQRMRTESGIPYYALKYPLIDLRLRREHCQDLIAKAGLPVPAKSSCWFCPYHSPAYWHRQKRQEPELFAKSVALEKLLNERRAARGKDAIWLTDKLRPLDQAIGDQMTLDEAMDTCESGYCEVAP